jgi:hypothetical protein
VDSGQFPFGNGDCQQASTSQEEWAILALRSSLYYLRRDTGIYSLASLRFPQDSTRIFQLVRFSVATLATRTYGRTTKTLIEAENTEKSWNIWKTDHLCQFKSCLLVASRNLL